MNEYDDREDDVVLSQKEYLILVRDNERMREEIQEALRNLKEMSGMMQTEDIENLDHAIDSLEGKLK